MTKTNALTVCRSITSHCSECGDQVEGDETCSEHPGADIESISTLLASDGTELGVDVRVEAGKPGTEDYDTGRVVEVDGDFVVVAWDSQIRTRAHASVLRGA